MLGIIERIKARIRERLRPREVYRKVPQEEWERLQQLYHHVTRELARLQGEVERLRSENELLRKQLRKKL